MEKEFIINNEKEMIDFGMKIGFLAFPNMVITLEGDLGAGKTTMTKGIGKALGVTKAINSPTFTIMKVYEGKMPLFHMDVYRISDDSGDDYLEEYFEQNGVCVIEWADNIKSMLPDSRLDIKILVDDSFNRHITISSNSTEYENLIANL